MKRAMFSTLAVVVLAGLAGCITQHGRRPWACLGGSCAQAPENCESCDDPGATCNDPGATCSDPGDNGTDPGRAVRGCRECGGRGCRLCCRGRECERPCVAPGPPSGTITYPYYTNRGPRDFLAKNPTSIGP